MKVYIVLSNNCGMGPSVQGVFESLEDALKYEKENPNYYLYSNIPTEVQRTSNTSYAFVPIAKVHCHKTWSAVDIKDEVPPTNIHDVEEGEILYVFRTIKTNE